MALFFFFSSSTSEHAQMVHSWLMAALTRALYIRSRNRIMKLSTQPFLKELCILLIGVHMVSTALLQVIELLTILIDAMRPLL
jgi:hypothetical protein